MRASNIKETTPSSNNTLPKLLLWFIVFIGVFLVGFFVGKIDLEQIVTNKDSSRPDYIVNGDLKESYNEVDVNILWEVWRKLEEEYIEPDIDGQQLLYGAAKGLVDGLDDRYTTFLDPQETEEYFSSNKGEFEGIGATLKQDGDYVAVESPLDGSPAEKAGLQPNDIILEVDGEDISGVNVYEAAATIRGEAGTEVALTIYRPSDSSQFEVNITRGKIDLDNIVFSELEDGIVEIKIYKFTEESVEAFNRQWDGVVEQTLAADPNGIVIDLRNNPGGYVAAVEYVLGEFLEKGEITFMEEDKFGNREVYEVSRTGKLTDIPIVVIVNEGSASASEIFAGAIQDHNRGQIIGMPTVGKGVEQRLISLSDGSTLQVVFQKWLTPKGTNISSEDPIHPDVEIEDRDEQDQKALEILK
ncbi:S41 family peptidase [Candidatus Dojkabacteria bacterium]|uniref:S41 family peptidase n=1 Tax=Candidatus Dojkabacteria bacterium TaxID=2099670 RepID=A0A955RIW4_9BACT|nr:S41 family peptidase [Candidatus Dojkabacteria bacterium]